MLHFALPQVNPAGSSRAFGGPYMGPLGIWGPPLGAPRHLGAPIGGPHGSGGPRMGPPPYGAPQARGAPMGALRGPRVAGCFVSLCFAAFLGGWGAPCCD